MPSPAQFTSPSEHRYQNAVLVGVTLLLVGLSIALTQYKASSLVTTLAELFEMGSEAASWIMSVFTLVGIFLAFPAGGVIERIGFKKTMLLSSGVIVLGGVVGVIANGFSSGGLLILSRAIEGVALTFITTAAPVAIQKCVNPKNVSLATGLWGCWGNGGAVLAAVLTPQLFELAGFNGVWIAYAAVAAVVALLFALLIHDPGSESTLSARIEGAAMDPEPVDTGSYREFLTTDVVLFQVAFAIYNIIMLALLGVLPTVLQLPAKGFDITSSALASTVPSMVSLVSCPLVGALSDRIGRIKPIVLVTFSTLGPCLAVMFMQTGVAFWIAAVTLGLVGFSSTGLLISGWMQVIPRPELVSKGMGLLTFVQCVGQFLGTFLIQLLLGPDYGNYLFAGAVLCCLGLAGALCLLFVRLR